MRARISPFLAFAAFLVTLCFGVPASGQSRLNVDCTHQSLADLAARALPDTIINVKGACSGPIIITTDGLQINAVAPASINGNGKDAVTIIGAKRVALSGLLITGGVRGVVAQNGAQVFLHNVSVTNNTSSGIAALANSCVTLTAGSSQGNTLHGIDVEASSALVISGSYSISGNGAFGMNVNNGSSLTLSAANVTATNNGVGIQMTTNSSGSLDAQSILTSTANTGNGITIASGSHMASFGGTINASNNGLNGMSLNSTGGINLEAASQLNSSNNVGIGLLADDGSALTLVNSSLTGNLKDLQLTFGSRATITSTTIGTYVCDATVLTRGTAALTCPH